MELLVGMIGCASYLKLRTYYAKITGGAYSYLPSDGAKCSMDNLGGFVIKGLTITLSFNLQNIATFLMDVSAEFSVYKIPTYNVIIGVK